MLPPEDFFPIPIEKDRRDRLESNEGREPLSPPGIELFMLTGGYLLVFSPAC